MGENPVKEVVCKSVSPVSASNLTFKSCDSKSSSTEDIEMKDNAAYPHNNIEMYDDHDSMKEYYSAKMSCVDKMYDTVTWDCIKCKLLHNTFYSVYYTLFKLLFLYNFSCTVDNIQCGCVDTRLVNKIWREGQYDTQCSNNYS